MKRKCEKEEEKHQWLERRGRGGGRERRRGDFDEEVELVVVRMMIKITHKLYNSSPVSDDGEVSEDEVKNIIQVLRHQHQKQQHVVEKR